MPTLGDLKAGVTSGTFTDFHKLLLARVLTQILFLILHAIWWHLATSEADFIAMEGYTSFKDCSQRYMYQYYHVLHCIYIISLIIV